MVTMRIKRAEAGQAFSFLVVKTTCNLRSHFTCSVITQEAGPYWRDLARAAIDQIQLDEVCAHLDSVNTY